MAVKITNDPGSYYEAMQEPEAHKWKEDMKAEMSQFERLKVWTKAPRPKDKPVLTNRWVVVRKPNISTKSLNHYVRFVIKGYTQRPWFDYEESYTPVAKQESRRLLFALSAIKQWSVGQMDVDTAFLNADLEEEVFVEQPEGFSDGTHDSITYTA